MLGLRKPTIPTEIEFPAIGFGSFWARRVINKISILKGKKKKKDKKGFYRVGDDVDRLLLKRICSGGSVPVRITSHLSGRHMRTPMQSLARHLTRAQSSYNKIKKIYKAI